VPAVAAAFGVTAAHVDRAKDALLATVPSPRGVPGPPLAEALAEFEGHLREAITSMDAWRIPDAEGDWAACRSALDRSLAEAERLRLGAPALDYEGLVAVLGDLMDPLEAFDRAAARMRER
jgi:hypothetical protein